MSEDYGFRHWPATHGDEPEEQDYPAMSALLSPIDLIAVEQMVTGLRAAERTIDEDAIKEARRRVLGTPEEIAHAVIRKQAVRLAAAREETWLAEARESEAKLQVEIWRARAWGMGAALACFAMALGLAILKR